MVPTDSAPVPDGRPPELDLRLDGYDADEQIAHAFWFHIEMQADVFVPLAEHHTADGEHSFYVLFDRSATFDHPGTPPYVALHLKRDHDQRSFGFEHAELPLPAMAQSWLVHRGCPSDAIGLDPELGHQPADETTRTLERRLAGDGDHFAMGYSYTRDDPNDWVTVVALRALDGRPTSPYRVVVEEVDPDAWTHTLREGGFATVQAALQWCHDRLMGSAGPLPPVRTATSYTRPASPPKAPVAHPPGRSR